MLNTDENAKDCREILQAVYANIFVEYVAKNPLYTPGQPFKCVPRIMISTYRLQGSGCIVIP